MFYNYIDKVSNNLVNIKCANDQLEFIYRSLNTGAEKFLHKKKKFGGEYTQRKKKFILKIVRSLLRRKSKLSKKKFRSESRVENQRMLEEMECIEDELRQEEKNK